MIDAADAKEDVRIATKRLIRFRLCPTGSCSLTDAGGCSSGYGDYVIDMITYLESYFDAVATINEYKCQEIAATCDCENADNADYFAYDCYVAAGMESCSDRNPYEEDNGHGNNQEQFNLEEFVICARWENRNGRRHLEDRVEYFMGPYCAEQGGAIVFLGLFTDDSCTSFADSVGGTETYLASTGAAMPYGAESIIGMDCISCVEPKEYNVNGDDAEDADETSEMCEAIHKTAGKCETLLSLEAPNNNACTYMEGIKIIRKNGTTVERSMSSGSKTASVFIGLLLCCCFRSSCGIRLLPSHQARPCIHQPFRVNLLQTDADVVSTFIHIYIF